MAGSIFYTVFWKSVLCEDSVRKVIQTYSTISVKNLSSSPVAIRISWDNQDPFGTEPENGDSRMENNVAPNEIVSEGLKNHSSVQVWVWGASNTPATEVCNEKINRLF